MTFFAAAAIYYLQFPFSCCYFCKLRPSVLLSHSNFNASLNEKRFSKAKNIKIYAFAKDTNLKKFLSLAETRRNSRGVANEKKVQKFYCL